MRTILFALACMLAACASAQPAAQGEQTQSQQSSDSYTDARSSASDADVTIARRGFRSACQTRHSVGYCECLTGSMAQTLAPEDLNIAAAQFSGQTTSSARVSAARAQAEAACASVPR